MSRARNILSALSLRKSGGGRPDAEDQPLLNNGLPPSPSSSTARYHATSPDRSSYRPQDSNLNIVPEECSSEGDLSDDEEGDELSNAEFRRFKILYTFVPATAALCIVLLSLLRALALPSTPIPPLQTLYDVVTAASFFALGFTVLDELVPHSFLPFPFIVNPISTAVIATICRLALAHATLPLHPLTTWHDPTFARIWNMALGWSVAETLISIKQGYGTLALYNPDDLTASLSMGEASLSLHSQIGMMNKLVAREDVEEMFGIPFIRIPIFVLCLQRINSVLFSIGTMLLLTAHDAASVIIVFLHLLLHTPILLRTNKIGVHTVVYVGTLGSLGVFFAALGVWCVV